MPWPGMLTEPRVTRVQSLREGSAALGRLPREVQKQVEGHRRAGGVQHLIDLLRQIQVPAGQGVPKPQVQEGV